MHILLVFVDGVGVGENDSLLNPFLNVPMTTLRKLLGDIPTLAPKNGAGEQEVRGPVLQNGPYAMLVHTDAVLGVPGLPQSGTGQTTIFTGVNAPAAIGMHSGPYPNTDLQEILARDNLFQQLRARNLRVAFGNAYPPIFFERLERNKARRTATMQAALAAGVRLRGVDDLARGEAVSAFSLSNREWRKRGVPLPALTPREAGHNLMRIAQENDFTTFEYALTDMAGHKNDREWIIEVLDELDEFWGGLVEEMDSQQTLLIITSDHGNIEDWSVKGHTRNPVPTILVGARRSQVASQIHSLVDITPAIVRALEDENKDNKID